MAVGLMSELSGRRLIVVLARKLGQFLPELSWPQHRNIAFFAEKRTFALVLRITASGRLLPVVSTSKPVIAYWNDGQSRPAPAPEGLSPMTTHALKNPGWKRKSHGDRKSRAPDSSTGARPWPKPPSGAFSFPSSPPPLHKTHPYTGHHFLFPFPQRQQ